VNPLDSGQLFQMTLANPNPTSGKNKDGPVYRVSFEFSREEWLAFMDANTKGMVIEIDQARVIHGDASAPSPKAAKPKGEHGEFARALKLSNFLGREVVRLALGTDAMYQAWLKTQCCIFIPTGECHGDIVAAHVRVTEVSEDMHGGGTGIKPADVGRGELL